jgi:hypothetical protein
LHADAQGTCLLCILHGAFHGTPERDAAGELIGDALRDQAPRRVRAA